MSIPQVSTSYFIFSIWISNTKKRYRYVKGVSKVAHTNNFDKIRILLYKFRHILFAYLTCARIHVVHFAHIFLRLKKHGNLQRLHSKILKMRFPLLIKGVVFRRVTQK